MTEFSKDHYRTPKYVFKWLNKRFDFHIDGCASENNALCSAWVGEGSPLGNNFLHPVTGEEVKGNSKGQMVVVFDPTMNDFVMRSVTLDFVKKCGGYGK